MMSVTSSSPSSCSSMKAASSNPSSSARPHPRRLRPPRHQQSSCPGLGVRVLERNRFGLCGLRDHQPLLPARVLRRAAASPVASLVTITIFFFCYVLVSVMLCVFYWLDVLLASWISGASQVLGNASIVLGGASRVWCNAKGFGRRPRVSGWEAPHIYCDPWIPSA